MARWVKTFDKEPERKAEVARPGRPSVNDDQAAAVLGDTDRSQTIRELNQAIGLSHATMLHILKNRKRMKKITSLWVPQDSTEGQR